MITIAALALAVTVAAAVPPVLSCGSARAASPRLRAMTHVSSLTGLALRPAAGVVSAGPGQGAALRRRPPPEQCSGARADWGEPWAAAPRR